MGKKIKKIIYYFGILAVLVAAMVFLYGRKYPTLPVVAVSNLPEMSLEKVGQKIIVFSPHLDDETLGAAGLISKAVGNGDEVYVVFLTNGDGHRFSSIEEFKKIYPTHNDYIQSGYSRQEESRRALAILGVKGQNIIFLGYPDGGLKKMMVQNWALPFKSPYTDRSSSPYNNSYQLNVPYSGENLQKNIVSILNDLQPNTVFVTGQADLHPDHLAANFYVKSAVQEMSGPKPQIYCYLIHYRHFPNPKGLHQNEPLTPPLRLFSRGTQFSKFTLDPASLKLKTEATRQYKSQLGSPMLKGLMWGFIRQNELFFTQN